MQNIQLVPAYGRDYKNQTEVLADWNANKDFWTADIIHGYGEPQTSRTATQWVCVL